MNMTETVMAQKAHHVAVCILQDSKLISYRVLDVTREYPPLVKELGLRAVASHPEMAGLPWLPGIRMDGATPDVLTLEAWPCPPGPGDAPLAVLSVPVANFSWMARQLASRAGLKGQYHMAVLALAPDSPHVADWKARTADVDFEISETTPELRLQAGFRNGPAPQPSHPIGEDGPSWLRCGFTARAFRSFLEAAEQERRVERSWAGIGSALLLPQGCITVIEELVEIPGEAGLSFIKTRGHEWATVKDQLDERSLVAYLHLHPRIVESTRITPSPSDNDSVLFWDFDLASPWPCVFPIALFMADARSAASDLAAYGYETGLLRQIPLEVYDEIK
jgi:hypothetical protein